MVNNGSLWKQIDQIYQNGFDQQRCRFDKMKLLLLNSSFWFQIDMDILEIDNKIAFELLCLKGLKLSYNLIYLFISHQYHYSEQDYDCYQT